MNMVTSIVSASGVILVMALAFVGCTERDPYYCAPDCEPYYVGDGDCDPECNFDVCDYDDGDCGEDNRCSPDCLPDWIGDDYCDLDCYSAACNYDGGDCDGMCNLGCYDDWISDGECDPLCNVAACGFDGGDCS